jgi:hypothetical protein
MGKFCGMKTGGRVNHPAIAFSQRGIDQSNECF